MVDVNSGLVTLGAAYGSKDIIIKLLGPTAEYLGGGLRDFAIKRVENIITIFRKATSRLGDKIENEGSVPPRILKEIIETGSYINDEISAEYYGGILASSRSSVNRDDRCMTYLETIKKLSNYQIRLHYLIYAGIRQLFSDLTIKISNDSQSCRTYFPFSFCSSGMEFSSTEDSELILSHSLIGLDNNSLISPDYIMGGMDFLKASPGCSQTDISEDGFICSPSLYGVELFLWGMGLPDISINNFISTSIQVEKINNIILLPNLKKIGRSVFPVRSRFSKNRNSK